MFAFCSLFISQDVLKPYNDAIYGVLFVFFYSIGELTEVVNVAQCVL